MAATPPALFRFSVTARLLDAWVMKAVPMPISLSRRSEPWARAWSGSLGDSTLMTSAPSTAS